MLGFAGWGAAAQSKFPKAAAALVLFLTSRENEGAILQTGFALPSLKGMENDPFFQGSGTLSKISKLLYDGGELRRSGRLGRRRPTRRSSRPSTRPPSASSPGRRPASRRSTRPARRLMRRSPRSLSPLMHVQDRTWLCLHMASLPEVCISSIIDLCLCRF